MEQEQYSIVQYTRDHSGYRCGYCKSDDTNYSHGMHAYSLTVSQYQALIDRGWRRSGTYCYKPTMHRTCCPAYTIRCNAPSIKLSKSQKKVLKRMNNFLAHGTAKERSQGTSEQLEDGGGGSESFPEAAVRHHERLEREGRDKRPHLQQLLPLQDDQLQFQPPPSSVITTCSTTSSSQSLGSCAESSSPTSAASNKKLKTVMPGAGADPTKPACRKARLRRLEQRQAKLLLRLQQPQRDQHKNNLASGRDAPMPSESARDVPMSVESPKPGKKDNTPKTLEDLLTQSTTDNPAHKLELRLVRVDLTSDDSLAAPHQLFRRYQKAVHREADEECSFGVFYDFLVDTPLRAYFPSWGPSFGLGSFHQQYWLDDDKLIAVAVIDVLPSCVSSVYFYYDPDYSFLSLGTYSSLRELALTRQLQQQCSSIAWYYMGFYIHSCPKMRYKGRYDPSYLLCPETYSWHPIEAATKKLDSRKYSRLEDDASREDTDATNISIDKVLVLHERRQLRYSQYRQLKGADAELEAVIAEYVALVGKTAAAAVMLYLP